MLTIAEWDFNADSSMVKLFPNMLSVTFTTSFTLYLTANVKPDGLMVWAVGLKASETFYRLWVNLLNTQVVN